LHGLHHAGDCSFGFHTEPKGATNARRPPKNRTKPTGATHPQPSIVRLSFGPRGLRRLGSAGSPMPRTRAIPMP
jgi:hypothetical protein